ncbi:MAG TPA: stage II sporulation protein P [Bacillota bacterium]|nr:stage II sporulation protein P [Bacillota bacterium]
MRSAAFLCLLALLVLGPAGVRGSPVGRAGDLLPLPAPAATLAPGPRHPDRPVLVYTSHPRERYDDGTSIRAVAAVLAVGLRAAGFRRVALAPAVGAGPMAYLRSRALVAAYAWRNPAWLVDVHRDDVGPGTYAGGLVGGRPAARLMLVVGVRNPQAWRAVPRARALAAAIEAEAPGLLRGIYLGPGDYNQDLGAVLVEVGNRDSTFAEVDAALPALARALAAAAP